MLLFLMQRRLVTINLVIFFVTSNSVKLAEKVAILAKPNGYKQSYHIFLY